MFNNESENMNPQTQENEQQETIQTAYSEHEYSESEGTVVQSDESAADETDYANGAYRENPYRGYGAYYAANPQNNTAYTEHVTEKSKNRVFPVVLTALITLVVCVMLCAALIGLDVISIGTEHDRDNALNNPYIQQTAAPAKTASPDKDASQGLIIGNDSSQSSSADNIINSCTRSVVSINVQTVSSSFYYGDNVTTSSGSGVIITSDGYVVTCNHVVEAANSISVSLQDGTMYEANVVGFDSRTDLAVLKIEAKNLPAATIGDSGNYNVGDRVYALGNPLGEFASTVTDGIISGINRTIEIDGIAMTLMQTNAAINPGNSGGGLFSAETGELVGIVNAKNYGIEIEGLGFAIPTTTAHEIIADLMDLGYVTGRPYIGISTQVISVSNGYGFFGQLSGETRVKITAVSENSPAEKAGISAGDYLISFDGTAIYDMNDLDGVMNKSDAGDKVDVVVERNGQRITLSLTLGEASGN